MSVAKVHRPRDPAATSRLMKVIRRRDTAAEMILRRTIWRKGLRYVTQDRELPGTPDVVFRGARVAVFVDGDYWHGRVLIDRGLRALKLTFRTRNRNFWIEKVVRNVERDHRQTAELRSLGWSVLRLWERDVLRDPHREALKVYRIVRRRTI